MNGSKNIPEGWKEGMLSDLATVVMGQSPKSEDVNDIGDGKPLLNGPTEFGGTHPYPTQFTTNGKKVSQVGDLLFCVRGSTTGRMNWSDQEYIIGRGLATIRHNEDLECQPLLRAIIEYNLPNLLVSATGSTFPNVSKDLLNQLYVDLPPLPEQKAIAHILGKLDDKIDLLRRMNQTLEDMAQALFHEWFDEMDFENTIEDLINIQNGYAFKSKDFLEFGEHRVLKIKNISNNVVNVSTSDFVSAEVVEKVNDKFKIESGDILFAMTGAEIGKMGLVEKNSISLWLNQRVGLFKEKYLGSKYLTYLCLQSDFGQYYITNTATGSVQPNISSTGIEACPFPKISVDEIKKYSKILAPFFEKIISNQAQINTLIQLRDTLLPKLMSGEIRVKY